MVGREEQPGEAIPSDLFGCVPACSSPMRQQVQRIPLLEVRQAPELEAGVVAQEARVARQEPGQLPAEVTEARQDVPGLAQSRGLEQTEQKGRVVERRREGL